MKSLFVLPVKSIELFNPAILKDIEISRPLGISVRTAENKSTKKFENQAYIFDSKKWKIDDAKAWLLEHEASAEEVIAKYGKLPIFKGVNFEIKELSETDRSFWAVASTNTQDRAGDIMHSDGWDTKDFMNNPVLLWAHNYSEPPIGKVIQLKNTDNQLLFKPQFISKEISEFADMIFKMYQGGYLNAFSVGFDPTEWSMMMDKEGYATGREYFKQTLLEISGCPVPCNQEALQMHSMKELMKKTYGSKIEIKTEDKPVKPPEETKPPETVPPVTPPVEPPAPVGPKNIIEPIMVKDLAELNEVMTIWKSGRIISEKNAQVIRDCIKGMDDHLKTTKEHHATITKCLKSLLELTNGNDEAEAEEESGKAFQAEVEKALKASKDLLSK